MYVSRRESIIESPLNRAVIQNIEIAAIVNKATKSTLTINHRGTASDH